MDELGPREKLFALGPEMLSESELVALILRTGCAGKRAREIAASLLEQVGSLRALAEAPMASICRVPGIGLAKAASLLAAIEIARRLMSPRALDEPICDSEAVYQRCRALGWLDVESLSVLALDARNRLLHRFCVARGSLLGCSFRPRDVFAPLLRLPTRSAILVHNHPSGDPTPSAEDIALTERLSAAGRLLGIELLDHVVIGDGRYESLRDRGEL